jgi:signal transduction histidine kinase
MSPTHAQGHDSPNEWPLTVPLVCSVIVGITTGIAVFQDRYAGYSLTLGFVAAGFILLPFLLDLVAYFWKPVAIPLWLFPFPVFAGLAYFVFRPAETDFAPFVLVFMAGELMSRARESRSAGFIALGGSIALMVTAETLGPWQYGAVIWVSGISFGALGGYLVRMLDQRTHELEAAQAGLAEKAAADERSRIAREVHDVIAHSLSVTMLHVTAARMALEKGDRPQDAADSLREAEQQGRRSLAEIRRTVGLLGPEESATAAPMPTTSDLPKLVQEFRDAGLDATLSMQGDIAALAPAAGLNIYRIVQESLTNVAKHAPHTKATVQLDVTPSDIRLVVHNELNGARPARTEDGLGLRGMAERAATLGGELRTDDADGWTISVVAPRQPA